MKENIKKKIRAPTKVLGVVGLCLLSTMGFVGCSVNEEFVKQYSEVTRVLQNDDYVEVAQPKRALENKTYHKSISYFCNYDSQYTYLNDNYLGLNIEVDYSYVYEIPIYAFNTFNVRYSGIYKDYNNNVQLIEFTSVYGSFSSDISNVAILDIDDADEYLPYFHVNLITQNIDDETMSINLQVANKFIFLCEVDRVGFDLELDLSDNIAPYFENIIATKYYWEGYDDGYRDGGEHTIDDNGLYILFESVFRAPSVMLEGMFNFEIFGINFKDIVMVIVTAAVIIFVVDILKGKPL